jgi:hypothetical protein
MNSAVRQWLDAKDDMEAERGYQVLLPHQVKELQEATASRTNREVIANGCVGTP